MRQTDMFQPAGSCRPVELLAAAYELDTNWMGQVYYSQKARPSELFWMDKESWVVKIDAVYAFDSISPIFRHD
jgi:hypothetical protein